MTKVGCPCGCGGIHHISYEQPSDVPMVFVEDEDLYETDACM